MKNGFITLLLVMFSSQTFGQVKRGVRDVFKDKTSIENPFDLRDPFKAPVSRRSNDKETESKKSIDGIYSNIAPMGQIELEKLQIVGVIIGKERYAMAKVEGRADTIKLIEGTRIGKDGAELKAIHPGGIILVEKLVNVYGEEEYLETVIPISK